MTDTNALAALADWFARHCNGDWEHSSGITIETLDNPGWRIRISLEDTELNRRHFERVEVERSNTDWLRVWVSEHTFNAACGPSNLEEALQIFLGWTSRE